MLNQTAFNIVWAILAVCMGSLFVFRTNFVLDKIYKQQFTGVNKLFQKKSKKEVYGYSTFCKVIGAGFLVLGTVTLLDCYSLTVQPKHANTFL